MPLRIVRDGVKWLRSFAMTSKSEENRFASRPIVVVFGSTGVGKSKLGVRLAKKFNGEVISADSMQIYKGLDILTNKMKPDEMDGVPHHMMSFLDPGTECRVGEFRDRALSAIDGIYDRGRLPIVVGGTNYYIEALLWRVLVDSGGGEFVERRRAELGVDLADAALDAMTTERAFELLCRVDRESADRLHQNDRRKILRALQVYWQTGRTMSSVLEEQRCQPGGSCLGGPLRFDRAAIFWLHADQSVLDARIDARTDQMLDEGLVAELREFHERFTAEKLAQGVEPDYTRGVYQSIGLRNFHDYLVASEEQREAVEGRAAFSKAVEELKLYTRRYARKQKKWVVNRFLRNPDRNRLLLFGLDATDLDAWHENVEARAFSVVSAFLSGGSVPVPTLKLADLDREVADRGLDVASSAAVSDRRDKTKHVCETCDRVFVGGVAWAAHLHSRKHARVAKSLKRKALADVEEGGKKVFEHVEEAA